MTEITCVSPIDGSVYASRPAETADAMRARIAKARTAQAEWRKRPLASASRWSRRASRASTG
jgi:acyl-CoA reductase-like NAD-dependent aldehyde dehydrogenase